MKRGSRIGHYLDPPIPPEFCAGFFPAPRTTKAKHRCRAAASFAELIERIDEIERQIAQKSLHAPVSGIVHMLAVHEAAAVVAGGEDILQIIPSKSSGIASVRISPMDIEAVHEGMTASLRLTGLNQRKTAELQGEVIRVSADIFTDEASQSSYYLTEIRIDPQDWAGLEGLNIKPGMPVQSFVHTGDQAPVSYLIGPLLDYMSGAFRTR